MDYSLRLPAADYEADDVLVVREPERLRALGHNVRHEIVVRLREHARSVSELAGELELPKGTVGHHVKVLEDAGLVRVVRTRKVRAVTEKFYGRTARLFVMNDEDTALARLTDEAVQRFEKRLGKLMADFRDADSDDGRPYELSTSLALKKDA